MPRLSQTDLETVKALNSHLAIFVDGAPPAIRTVLPELRSLLGADRAVSYGIRGEDGVLAMDFLHATSMEHVMREVLDRMYREEPEGIGHFNPARPDVRQRNRAFLIDELADLTGNESPRAFTEGFPRVGLRGMDQARVLVCEGDSLLAWFGAFRYEPFTWRERRLLDELAPAVRRRMWMERQLDACQFAFAALDEALSLLPTAAFVVRATGQIVHANEAGRQRLDRESPVVRESLERSLRFPCPEAPFRMNPLSVRGAPGYWLAVESGDRSARAAIGADAARRFGLTPRQAQVLRLLLRGYANKSIAADLQCSPSTVEQHVTAILRKLGAATRAELIVKLSPLE